MTYYQLSALINCISSFAIGLIVYLKNTRNQLNISFSSFCISVGLWSFGYFLWQCSTSKESALLWCRILMACASFISPAFFHFVITLLELDTKKFYKNLITLGYIFAFIFLIISPTPLFVKEISSNKYFSLWPKPGAMYPLYLLMFFGYAIYSWYLMLIRYTSFTGAKRNQIKYILLGTIIGYLGGSTNYPLWYNIPILPLGNCFVTVYVLSIGYAIVKYRLLDIHFVIRKTLTNVILITLICGLIWAIFLFKLDRLTELILYFSVIGFSVLYIPKLKLIFESAIIHILFKGKYDYLDKIESFIERMALIPKEEDLINNTVKVLTRDMYIEKASFYILDRVTDDYTINHKVNLDIPIDFKISHEEEIVKWLKENKKIFILEEEEKILPSEKLINIKKTMETIQGKICAPVKIDSDLMGILVLSNKSSGEMYTHMDLGLLQRLGTQLAIALNYKKIESQLRKEHELAAIGIMSMEISHELRNLLQLPRTFIDLSAERRTDDEFFKDFRNMALDRMKVTSDKLNDIMYLGKERPPNLKANIDINNLLDENIRANDVSIKKENVEIIKEYSQIPTMRADSSQLTHLFNNLILNAMDAMKNKGGGKLRIRTQVCDNITSGMKDRANDWIRVEIKDDGTGIPDHVLNKLFTPFVTTKSLGHIERSGTGLGLSVVKKMIDAHKGFIHVNTKEGKGTTFVVDLPVEIKPSYKGQEAEPLKGEPWEYKE